MIDEPNPEAPRWRIVDHAEPLGALLQPFDRRRIAAAADADGRLVLVRPDQVLVGRSGGSDDDALVERVAQLDGELAERLRAGEPITEGLVRVELTPSRPVATEAPAPWPATPVGRALAVLDAAEASAMPNYVLLGSQGIKGSPVGATAHFVGGMMFTADTVVTPAGTAVRTTADPAGPPAFVRPPLRLGPVPCVLVADTGLCTTGGAGSAPEHPELADVVVHGGWWRDPTPMAIDDEDEQDDDGLGYLDFEAGHGTFIAGVVRQICPDAEIHVRGVLSSFGDGDVATLLLRLGQARKEIGRPLDLVVLSLGGYMSEADAGLFRQQLALVLDGALAVAAAGNQATSRPYYPAALDDVVGVGGLGEDGRAWFSNFGGWVDACAPAIDVVSTFFLDAPEPDGPHFRGWARWSGTSFAAPKVAAALAQEMVLTGSTAAEAWRRLSDHQRLRVPDLGTVFNV